MEYLKCEFVDIVRQIQDLVALILQQFCLRQFVDLVEAFAAGEEDVFLILLHSAYVFFQSYKCIFAGGMEHYQIFEGFCVSAIAVIQSVFQLQTEVLVEFQVLVSVVFLHVEQLTLDLLFQALCDRLKLSVMLQHFSGNVERQILGVYQTLYEAEIVRQQIRALIHDQHAGRIELQTLFVVLCIVIVRSL